MLHRLCCKLLKGYLSDFYFHLSVFIIITSSIVLQEVQSLSVEQDLVLTRGEKLALDKVFWHTTLFLILSSDGTSVSVRRIYLKCDIIKIV